MKMREYRGSKLSADIVVYDELSTFTRKQFNYLLKRGYLQKKWTNWKGSTMKACDARRLNRWKMNERNSPSNRRRKRDAFDAQRRERQEWRRKFLNELMSFRSEIV